MQYYAKLCELIQPSDWPTDRKIVRCQTRVKLARLLISDKKSDRTMTGGDDSRRGRTAQSRRDVESRTDVRRHLERMPGSRACSPRERLTALDVHGKISRTTTCGYVRACGQLRSTVRRHDDVHEPETPACRDAVRTRQVNGRDAPTNTSFLDELRNLLPVVSHLSTSHCPTMHVG